MHRSTTDLALREMKSLLQQMTKTAEELGDQPFLEEAPFPGGSKGTVAKVNGLYRTNWFNGRFLTADAFRADQIYADTRGRMVAQIHPPGIAWGLTLDMALPAEVILTGPDTGEAAAEATPPPAAPPAAAQPAAAQPSAAALPPLPDGLTEQDREALCRMLAAGDTQGVAQLIQQFGITLAQARDLCNPEPEPEPKPKPDAGWPLTTRIGLDPGLAFDDLGRPISVGRRHEFTFTDLVNRYRTRPTVVVGGGTSFAPCACVQRVPPDAVPPGAALPEGPYLLLITPIEAPEGQARKSANPCAGRSIDGSCEAEGWRGGYELSLARLSIQIPVRSWNNAWDLRGLISGWYFDVYEHDLRSRWNRAGASDPRFPSDPKMWKGPGPKSRTESSVPLALVFFGPEGTVSFLDAWIPRRPIASTGAQAWADNVRGAPTPSARIARVHQFQTMLNESLEHTPHHQGDVGGYGPNLYLRGFRHIPPWGVLPVRTPPPPDPKNLFGTLLSDAQAIKQARADAKAYFHGTNVFVSGHVALHDDDVLEDILRADQKDPITLRLHDRPYRHAELMECLARQIGSSWISWVLSNLLGAILRAVGDVTLDQLIHRELDAVKLFIPMNPTRRELAIVGRSSSDPLAGLFDAWSEASGTNFDNPFEGLVCEPRPFVVYVKQRMVLLDTLYLAVDLILDLMEVMVRVLGEWLTTCKQSEDALYESAADSMLPRSKRRNAAISWSPIAMKKATLPLRAAGGETARVLLDSPGIRPALLSGLVQAFPELSIASSWTAYDALKASDNVDVALQALADEHQGFGILKGASLVLPEDLFDNLTSELAGRATAGDQTLSGATFHKDGYLANPEEREVAGALKDAYAARPLRSVSGVSGVSGAHTVGDILDDSKERITRTLGAPAAKKVSEAVDRDAAVLAEFGPKLAKSRTLNRPEFFDALREATDKAGGELRGGLETMAKTTGSKTAGRDLLTLSDTLGDEGTEALVERLELLARRP